MVSMNRNSAGPWHLRLRRRTSIGQSMHHRLRRLIRREEAATSVEYAVLLALILLVCIGAIGVFGTQTNQLFTNNNNSLRAVNFGS
jgi:pilus assembly protein Flp/PilA